MKLSFRGKVWIAALVACLAIWAAAWSFVIWFAAWLARHLFS